MNRAGPPGRAVARGIALVLLGVTCGAAQSRLPAGEADARSQPVPSAAIASTAARVILDRVRPSVIQIKGFFGTNTAEAFHGSGFAIGHRGVFVTNWHVVSEVVLYPEKYRLEYRTAAGATGRVTVRAIDVRHDLALVDAEGLAPPPLRLRPNAAIGGERAYSVGFPLDVGLTITEGISNGRVEDSFEPRVHYSGALNAGMSGGPGLDGAGNVIGVNVAGYRASQLVAFLVPAEHAVGLLAGASKPPLDVRQARDEVAQRIGCDAKSSLYLGRNLQPGGLSFQHQVFTTRTLDPWRFAHGMQAAKGSGDLFGSRRQLAPFACKQRNVELGGFTANATVCLRAYRKLDGIYDLHVRVVSKNGPRQGFLSSLIVTGVAPERALAFAKTYLDAMQWKP